jgi:uroporphyrinogen decarboxylase
MRQAGRYLPEYRAVRAKAGSFLSLCYDPELAAEVTLQPLRRFDLDAAILFSDILVVPHAMGLELTFVENEGPKLQTVTGAADVMRLGDGTSWQFARVFDTVARVKEELPKRAGLIGFCGAPWTVASYMIEGGSSDRAKALAVARENPPWFRTLIQRLVDCSIRYLCGQIEEAVQVFDSWAGDVPAELRERVVFNPIAQILAGVRAVHPDFPVIVFGRGLGGAHGALARATKANCVGVEEDADLRDLLSTLPVDCAVQGNLAPSVMSDEAVELAEVVPPILSAVPMARHVFNLGHGIRPDARPERVAALLAVIRAFDGKAGP